MMTRVFHKALMGLFMVAVMVAGSVNGARAQENSGMRVATVDVQQLMVDSKAGKSIQKQLVTQREAIQAEASNLEQSLQAEQKKLMGERGKASEEAFAQKQIDFEKRLLEARSKLQNRGRFLDKAANDSLNELRSHITDIVYNMATEQDIDLVLTRQNVVAAAKTIDITADVLKALDAKVPDIKVNVEGSKAEAKAPEAKAKGAAKPGKS